MTVNCAEVTRHWINVTYTFQSHLTNTSWIIYCCSIGHVSLPSQWDQYQYSLLCYQNNGFLSSVFISKS